MNGWYFSRMHRTRYWKVLYWDEAAGKFYRHLAVTDDFGNLVFVYWET